MSLVCSKDLQILTYLILTAALLVLLLEQLYYFTDEQTEAQKIK